MNGEKPVIIPLKNGETVIFEDIIKLEDTQIQELSKLSFNRTKQEWRAAEKGVTIHLTTDQKTSILNFKNELIFNFTASEMIEEDIISVLPHAQKRINYRLEGHDSDTPLNYETLIKLAQAIIDADQVKKAQWKASRSLTYTFLSTYNKKSIEISLTFRSAIVIVTIIVPKGGPSKKDPGFTVRDIIEYKKNKQSLEN
nr:hypothetical protein [Paenibacillus xylanexedens]